MIPFLGRRRIRQHQQVAIIAHTRAAEVGAGKAVHRTVGIVVTTTAVPPLIAGVRAQLYHSKRRLRTGVRVAVATGSDKWVDVINRCPLRILSRNL